MPANRFQKELDKLESLLDNLNTRTSRSKSRSPTKNRKQSAGKTRSLSKTRKQSAGKRRHRRSKSRSNSNSNSRSNSNSKRSKSPNSDNDRHFKLVSVSGKAVEDDGRYNLPAVTSQGKPNKRGPKEMASKAFTQLCKKHKRADDCHFKFAIQETTRGSNRKVYHYEGKRVKLQKAESYKVKDASGKVKSIVRKYRNELKSLGSEAAKNQKGGWVFYS